MKRFVILPALALALACGGGGGGSSTPPAAPPAAISGVWFGTVHSNGTGQNYSVQALVLPSGAFRYVASNWVEVVGNASVTGNQVSGAGTMYVPPSTTAALTVNATATSSTTISGTFAGGDTGTLSLTADSTANVSVALAALQGTFQSPGAFNSEGQTLNATVTSGGAISGTDPFGTFTGSLTQVSPGLNAFQVSLTYTLTAGGAVTAYTGLAYLEPGSPATIVVQANSSTGVFAAQFIYSGP